MHYVYECSLRRRDAAWEHPQGETLLKHLGRLVKPQDCYLAHAVFELTFW
jgi:hypothetical protein